MIKSKKQFSPIIALFVVTLLLSLTVHIPAGWLLQNDIVKQAMQSNGVELNGVTGTVFTGQANLNYQGRFVGQVEWHIKPLELVMLNASADVKWMYQTSAADGQLNVSLFSPHEVGLQNLKGALFVHDLSQLALPYLSQYSTFVKDAQGRLDITRTQMIFDTDQQWFNGFSLNAQAEKLALMGNQFPTLEVTGQQSEESGEVRFAVTGGEEGAWSLQLDSSLSPGFIQQGQLDLKAVSEKQLPDWAFTLRKRSPTHYQLIF